MGPKIIHKHEIQHKHITKGEWAKRLSAEDERAVIVGLSLS
jgi:hypothetical protein